MRHDQVESVVDQEPMEEDDFDFVPDGIEGKLPWSACPLVEQLANGAEDKIREDAGIDVLFELAGFHAFAHDALTELEKIDIVLHELTAPFTQQLMLLIDKEQGQGGITRKLVEKPVDDFFNVPSWEGQIPHL
jgi:hypothetical protein